MSKTIEEKMKEIAERAASVDEAKGLAKITPADTYKDAFAQYSQVTPSNEIDYSNTKGEMPKVENPDIVDKIDPNIVKSPMEVVKDAKEAQMFSDYINSLYSQSDYEADEKRKKAAQWVTAAQTLGDSLAALGNVYWTGKGAAPQQLSPGAGKAAAATYQLEQDIRNAREKAAKAKMDATLKKYEMEMQKEKDAKADKRYKEQQAETKAYREQQQRNWDKQFAANEQSRLDALARQAKEDEKWEKTYKLQQDRENRLNKDENKPEMFLLDEGWVSVPKKKWNDTEVAAVYAKIPAEIRESIEKVVTDEGYGKTTSKSIKPTPQQMRQWIGEYKHLPEVANAIRRLAGVTVEKVDSKEDKREKENTPTNNTEPPIQAYNAPAVEWGSQWRRRAGLDTTDFSQFKRK